MATRDVLAELVTAFEDSSGRTVVLESVGGVHAAQRVRAGERFDVIVLARDAIEALAEAGHLRRGTMVDFACSGVAVAVRTGAERPDIRDEAALRRAVLAARSVGTSTGPSGVALGRLFERWGIAAELRHRLVTPPPGIPVGDLIAGGRVELGFQQLSELARAPGVDVVGLLPPPIEIVTTFSAAIGATGPEGDGAAELIAFLVSQATADTKRRHGMEPAPDGPATVGQAARRAP